MKDSYFGDMNWWRVNAFCRHGRGRSPFLFVWEGILGYTYSISVCIYLYIHYMMYYTEYSVWLNLLQPFLFLAKFAKFVAGFRLGWRDAMNDSNVSALCPKPWKNIVVIHSRAFWRWRYLGFFSIQLPGGILFIKLFCRFNFGCPRVSIFWGDMIYSYPLHLCMVFIYIYIYIHLP